MLRAVYALDHIFMWLMAPLRRAALRAVARQIAREDDMELARLVHAARHPGRPFGASVDYASAR